MADYVTSGKGTTFHFNEKEKYVVKKKNSEFKTMRLYLKVDKDTKKSYFEGGVKLDNDQYIWISFGAKSDIHRDNKDRTYRNVSIKITAPSGTSAQQNF